MAITPVCADIALIEEITAWRLTSMLLLDDSDIAMFCPLSVRIPVTVLLLVTAEPETMFGFTDAATPVVLLIVLMAEAFAMAEPALLEEERLSLVVNEVGTV